jgi:hypothetical protein
MPSMASSLQILSFIITLTSPVELMDTMVVQTKGLMAFASFLQRISAIPCVGGLD